MVGAEQEHSPFTGHVTQVRFLTLDATVFPSASAFFVLISDSNFNIRFELLQVVLQSLKRVFHFSEKEEQ